MAVLLDLATLPDQCRSLGTGITEAASRIAQRATLDLVRTDSSLPAYPLLRRGKADLRFFVGRQQSKVVLFFIRRDGVEEVLFDAAIRFEVVAVPQREAALPITPSAVRHSLSVPACFRPEISATAQQKLLDTLGVGLDHAILFRYEGGAIAVNPETREIAWPQSAQRLRPGGPAYAWPLLAIVRNLGFWMQGRLQGSSELPLPPRLIALDSDFRETQRAMTEAWCALVNEVEQRTGGEAAEWVPPFVIRGYQTELTMLLDAVGDVARNDSDELVRLAASFEYMELPDGPIARMQLAPPDFLLFGPVYDRLLDVLESNRVLEQIEPTLNPLLKSRDVRSGAPAGSSHLDLLRAFVRSARERTSPGYGITVFRTRRGRKSVQLPDTDLFVMTGILGAIAPVHMVVKARVRVERREEDYFVEILAGGDSPEVLFCSHLPLPPNLEQMTEYFIRLIRQLNRWYGVASR